MRDGELTYRRDRNKEARYEHLRVHVRLPLQFKSAEEPRYDFIARQEDRSTRGWFSDRSVVYRPLGTPELALEFHVKRSKGVASEYGKKTKLEIPRPPPTQEAPEDQGPKQPEIAPPPKVKNERLSRRNAGYSELKRHIERSDARVRTVKSGSRFEDLVQPFAYLPLEPRGSAAQVLRVATEPLEEAYHAPAPPPGPPPPPTSFARTGRNQRDGSVLSLTASLSGHGPADRSPPRSFGGLALPMRGSSRMSTRYPQEQEKEQQATLTAEESQALLPSLLRLPFAPRRPGQQPSFVDEEKRMEKLTRKVREAVSDADVVALRPQFACTDTREQLREARDGFWELHGSLEERLLERLREKEFERARVFDRKFRAFRPDPHHLHASLDLDAMRLESERGRALARIASSTSCVGYVAAAQRVLQQGTGNVEPVRYIMGQLQRMLTDGIPFDERAFYVLAASLRPADLLAPDVADLVRTLRAHVGVSEAAFAAFCERHDLPPPPREAPPPAPDAEELRRLARSRNQKSRVTGEGSPGPAPLGAPPRPLPPASSAATSAPVSARGTPPHGPAAPPGGPVPVLVIGPPAAEKPAAPSSRVDFKEAEPPAPAPAPP